MEKISCTIIFKDFNPPCFSRCTARFLGQSMDEEAEFERIEKILKEKTTEEIDKIDSQISVLEQKLKVLSIRSLKTKWLLFLGFVVDEERKIYELREKRQNLIDNFSYDLYSQYIKFLKENGFVPSSCFKETVNERKVITAETFIKEF